MTYSGLRCQLISVMRLSSLINLSAFALLSRLTEVEGRPVRDLSFKRAYPD